MVVRVTLVEVISALSLLAVGAAMLAPRPGPADAHQREAAECRRHISQLDTALTQYASDHDGDYPAKLDGLTPEYLRTLPTCPQTLKGYDYDLTASPGAAGRVMPHYHEPPTVDLTPALDAYVKREGRYPASLGEVPDLPVCPLGSPFYYEVYNGTYTLQCKGKHPEATP